MSEQLAKLFHETYAKLAPAFNKVAGLRWEQLPDREKAFRIAVADHVELAYFGGSAANNDEELPSEFFASSNFGHRTRQPFVELVYNGRKLAQMSPEEATDLAHNLLACAEASLSDAFLIEFLHTRVGAPDEHIAGILLEFRQWRDKREESEP